MTAAAPLSMLAKDFWPPVEECLILGIKMSMKKTRHQEILADRRTFFWEMPSALGNA